MSIFDCQHKAKDLFVEKPSTIARMDDDFDLVTIHLYCRKCGAKLDFKHSQFVNGVEGFMRKEIDTVNSIVAKHEERNRDRT